MTDLGWFLLILISSGAPICSALEEQQAVVFTNLLCFKLFSCASHKQKTQTYTHSVYFYIFYIPVFNIALQAPPGDNKLVLGGSSWLN